MENTLINNTTKRLLLLNRYYKITQFYSFIKSTLYKGGSVMAIFVLILLGVDFFLLDINLLLNNFVENYSAQVVFPFFLLSETVLGLVPPEIFIAWASKAANPWVFLFLLATMSYVGGVVAYLLGNRLSLIPSVKNYIENKVAKHIENLRKWGGVFVVLGAVTPLPHSMVSLASGLIKYNFKQYLLWALFRYVRFAIYAAIIFQVF